ncbi:hypothetical protein ATK36_4535 [Amycolatopsis sulphurea]|uniref:Uncharacterized protein n=1 Tax=Amycolatopsis sulphurea TaxID=76022 RepID=A0A2A9FDF0_9PSEU|nr:hypothetical protein ATK36_4535 [Amycolatopsis sulphurea]
MISRESRGCPTGFGSVKGPFTDSESVKGPFTALRSYAGALHTDFADTVVGDPVRVVGKMHSSRVRPTSTAPTARSRAAMTPSTVAGA